ncbi:MAG: TetR/AcrR family transcriptional regulator, partial [Verrucomicrobium sp.]
MKRQPVPHPTSDLVAPPSPSVAVTDEQASPLPRRRNATTTREAILESARRAFVQAGYDGAGVREIAKGAGVTAMLVNRYFGSKEKLFAEVIAKSMAAPTILRAENLASKDMSTAFASALVGITQSGALPLDGFLILLRSASSERAAEIGREEIEKGHQKTLSTALQGSHAAERAALVLALVAGVQMMRQMMALPALAVADPEVLM